MFSDLSNQTKAKIIARQSSLQCSHQAVGGLSVTCNCGWSDKTRCCLRLALIAIIVFVYVSAVGQTMVQGRVELPKSHSAPVMAKRYEIVTRGSVISTQPPLAVVYLDGSFPKPKSHTTKTVAQKDLAFLPSLLPVQVGTRVEFPNFDDTYHSIFSYSPAKRFDLGRYRPDERPIPSEVFDTPGLVTLRCDIHEHMRGLILVLNTPYFVTTDTDGQFQLRGLPPGHYRLKAWIDSKTTRERPVELKSGETVHVDFP
jgi:plastocyanin